MVPQSSRLCTIPTIILEHIALELALLDPLGPPAHLIPLLQTCKHVNAVLSHVTNNALYGAIFTLKFDKRAANRRLGEEAVYSSNLSSQLRKQCIALGRIRSGDISSPFIEEDFWTAFIMMLENDGKNAAQLLEYAKLDALVEQFLHTRLWEGREQSSGWPAESTANALAVWLCWMCIDQTRHMAYTVDQMVEIRRLIGPYIVTTIRYPFYHAPDNHFDFPLAPIFATEFPFALSTPHGFWPQYRDPDMVRERIQHYGEVISVAPPLLALGARLLYWTLAERRVWQYEEDWPVDREDAIRTGRPAYPTQADIIELNATRDVKLFDRGDWDWRAKLLREEGADEDDGTWRTTLKAVSAQWDCDWARLRGCIDPIRLDPHKGPVYVPGTLSGLWKGRLSNPDIPAIRAFMTGSHFPEEFATHAPTLLEYPLYMLFREHHAVSPRIPVPPGGRPEEYDDGLCNAWFPAGLDLRERAGRIQARDAATGFVTEYETFEEGRPNSHNEDTCDVCRHHTREEEMDEDEDTDEDFPALMDMDGGNDIIAHIRARVNAAFNDENMDVDGVLDEELAGEDGADPDDWTSTDGSDDEAGDEQPPLERTCSGIQDIIVTGETLDRHGAAWGHYVFYGRVRAWDGLIAVVRKREPPRANDPTRDVHIFRGYIVGGANFVGSVRPWTHNPRAITGEGPFNMSKV
ncbi:hypothetical protein CERSUDRAFT_99341 [Gelatoporia subvermispora B]|uniref:F-box domain-containing protein n=1 Tax=Ceriporiopsis subvermispora (strain B) TaxID=914234 RepID=M2R2Y0_CERS8|nr:hypothetical protein CERSUDRAFT_99341 [Gelatoporia subvermispora B]